MLFPPHALHLAFRNVVHVGGTVIFLVAYDCDSLCAMHVLGTMLKSESTSWDCRPVRGYGDLSSFFSSLIDNPNPMIRSVFLINCGGSVDLASEYNLHLLPGLFVYVVDSRRPFSHRNALKQNTQVILFGNAQDLAAMDQLPWAEDDEAVLLEHDNAGADDDEDNDDDDDEAENERQEASDEEEEEEEDELDANVATSSPSKASRGSKPGRSPTKKRVRATTERHEMHSAMLERLNRYYQGSYHADPASHTAFQMALQTSKDDIALLWLVLVGVTQRYTSGDLPRVSYEHFVAELSEHVKNRKAMPRELDLGVVLDEEIVLSLPEGTTIDFLENDLDLMLYRHWSLADALAYSDSTANVLGSWNAEDSDALLHLLADIGVPLKIAKQNFSSMSSKMRDELPAKLEEHREKYNLGTLGFPSFVLRVGFGRGVSAADVGCVCTALLEGGHEEGTPESLNEAYFAERFNQAYEVFDMTRNEEILNKGFQMSIELQKTIVKQGVAIMRAKDIQLAGDFRFAIIKSVGNVGSRLFSSPIALLRLAKFLLRAHKASGRWRGSSAKPLILAVNDPHGTDALVCGIPCPDVGTVHKNAFARKFRQLTSKPEWQTPVRFETFDTSIIQLKADLVMDFLFALTDVFAEG